MGSTATQDIAGKAAPRSDMRESRARSRSNSKTRSPSVPSRSRKSRSRSHSRERSSQRRRSRSPTQRKPHDSSRSSRSHRSSRRSHRSRSRSTSRDRRRGSGSRRSDHRSSRSGRKDRHRDRSVSRSRSRGRHGHSESSNRKRRHQDRSSSRERRRGSGDGDELSYRDRQRRRRDSSSPHDPTRCSSGPIATDSQALANKKETAGARDKVEESTPTSQESVATSTGAMTATTTSSQSDVEMLSQQPIDAVAQENKNEKQQEETPAVQQTPVKTSAKVDVQSIKMNILKALADARSAIADIKGVTGTPSVGSEVASESNVTTADAGAGVGKENDEDKRGERVASQSVAASTARSPQRTEVAAADVDEFDIFSAADRLGSGLPLSPVAVGAAPALVDAAIQSNYDDPEGYYKPSIGEVLNGKYRVLGTVGKGVFSTVLRCQLVASASSTTTHEHEPEVVAIKLIRSNEVMREASQLEIKILTELSARDPRDKKHCVRLLERFEHRNHVALVFEPMQMNVREAMKKFGGKGGISIQAVRIFCKHLLIALTHLEACNVVHADIKPDNVLLDDKQTMIKLCDFGSAFKMQEGNHDPTPYLVSRFYRAPEIVLGLPYDKAVDMWSVGCCLYEMFTGKVLFPGATNNEMLKLFMELKGKVPNKIIKKHRQAYIEQFQMEPHFTEDNKFISRELDRVTSKPVLRYLDAIKTRFDLGGALLGAKSSTDDRKQVLELRNLLERMFTLDPTKRITPKEALAHPFVKTEPTKP